MTVADGCSIVPTWGDVAMMGVCLGLPAVTVVAICWTYLKSRRG